MHVSEKRINFADVIELGRHIEILLLSNDCVIVPGFGGFMAHHVEARYDDRDGLFLPPLRMLGFNPLLTINDSLLVQSYVEAYDISYPEALSRIEEEVKAVEREIRETGSYEINNIGEISLNEEGHYLFTPCEAGILTPNLYGLYSFAFATLDKAAAPAVVQAPTLSIGAAEERPTITVGNTMPEMITIGQGAMDENDGSEDMADDNANADDMSDGEYEDGERVITIKMSWIRNVAVAAAVIIAAFFITSPIANSDDNIASTELIQQSMMAGVVPTKAEAPMVAKVETAAVAEPKEETAAVAEPKVETKAETSAETPVAAEPKEAAKPAAKPAENIAAKPAAKPAVKSEVKQAAKVEEGKYCIVLASHVTKKNAEVYASQLQSQGYKDSYVYTRNGIVRVVYGHFADEAKAYEQLRHLRKEKSDFGQAWVYKQR